MSPNRRMRRAARGPDTQRVATGILEAIEAITDRLGLLQNAVNDCITLTNGAIAAHNSLVEYLRSRQIVPPPVKITPGGIALPEGVQIPDGAVSMPEVRKDS